MEAIDRYSSLFLPYPLSKSIKTYPQVSISKYKTEIKRLPGLPCPGREFITEWLQIHFTHQVLQKERRPQL